MMIFIFIFSYSLILKKLLTQKASLFPFFLYFQHTPLAAAAGGIKSVSSHQRLRPGGTLANIMQIFQLSKHLYEQPKQAHDLDSHRLGPYRRVF